MAFLDWAIVGFYIVCATAAGIFFAKRASQSTTDFFVAGRSLTWYIAGTSLVAVSFSADTPLLCAGISRNIGIYSNWFWWSFVFGSTATVFFFARLWRRTEVLTDVEFLVQRYEPSRAVSFLRVFKVFTDGVLINCVTMAIATLAMLKLIKVMLHLSETPLFTIPFFGGVTPGILLLLVLCASVVFFTLVAGLNGVVYLDTIQFIFAMVGSIALAIIVYVDVSKGAGFLEKIKSSPAYKPDSIRFFPDLTKANLLTFTFFIYVFLIWWQSAPGGYYGVQRLLATRSEKDSVLAFLWYNVCLYIVRTWPWVLVGIASLYYLPELKDPDMAFPAMIDKFMPIGLKGIMITSLLAAFNGSTNSLLNWGTSYIINDFYQPYVVKGRDPKHYVFATRIAMILLTLVVVIITTHVSGIFDVTKYITVLAAGIGTILIARWYWWRVNAYSEIAAIASTVILGNVLAIWLPDKPEADYFAVRLAITIAVSTPFWVIVTFLTSKEPSQKAIEFYTRMRIGGPGWKKISQLTGIQPEDTEFVNNVIAWLSCTAFIICLMLSIGKFLFLEWTAAVLYLIGAVISAGILKTRMSKIKFLGN